MEVSQLLFGVVLVVVMLALSGYYGWSQVQTLKLLRASQESPEDQAFLRSQARRRLTGCFFMALFAVLFAGWFLFGIDGITNDLVRQGQEARNGGEPAEMTPEQRQAFRKVALYAIGTMLVFLMLIITAGLDVLAIRRYRRRQFQQIRDDRRAMIERQVAKLRSQRNGHG